MANLRIIPNNLVDLTTSTLTVSSTSSASVVGANLKNDLKSVVWRSATSGTVMVKANLLLTFSSSVIGGVVLAFTNLSASAKIRVIGYTGNPPTLGGSVDAPNISGGGSVRFNTGFVYANPPLPLGTWEWGFLPLGANAQELRKRYARVWCPGLDCTSITIEIDDPNNPDRYVEASRLIVGNYWSPKYNTSYGLSSAVNDMSTSERTEAGDLVSSAGATYSSMSFDLKNLNVVDRANYNAMIRSRGSKKPLFISLFPEDYDIGKEQMYQIYGKLSKLYGIEHPIFDMYSSQIEVEEV